VSAARAAGRIRRASRFGRRERSRRHVHDRSRKSKHESSNTLRAYYYERVVTRDLVRG
jgi:hypothetical protein